MQILLDNWFIILGIIILIFGFIFGFYTFITCPTEGKLNKVKEWLLYAVTEAEKELGGGTGQIKLRYVYNMFLKNFSYIAKFISFDDFSKLVDEALVKFRTLLDTNKKIKEYVEKEDSK